MSKGRRFTRKQIISFILVGGGLFLMTGRASPESASLPCHQHPAATTESSYQEQGQPSSPAYEGLQRFRKNGRLHLSLEDCLLVAMARNLDVRLTEEALIQADEQISQTRSAMLPSLDAEASYTRLDEDLSFAMGPESLTFMKRNLYRAGIVVRQPVFMGGRLKAARKAAQYSWKAQDQQKRSVENEIVFQVTRTYRSVQVAEVLQKVAAESANLLEVHEHDVAILVDKGANPEIDLLRTRTEVANARKDLNVANNAVDLTRSRLKDLLSIHLEESLFLTEQLGRPPRPTGDLRSLTQLAISQRPELSAIGYRIKVAEQSLKAAKGEYMPSIALEGRYEYIKGNFRDLEGGGHWTIGIGAQLPIWNWGETASKVRQAGSQFAQLEIERDKTEDRIRLEVREAFLNLGNAEQNIEASLTALNTANEAYRQGRAAYRAGEGTNTDVLDARTALSRAEGNHTQALFDYNVALAALRRAVTTTDLGRADLQKKGPAK